MFIIMTLSYLFRSIVIFVIVECLNADHHANSYEGFIENKHPIQIIYITQKNGTFKNKYTPRITDGISYSELLLQQQYVIDKTLLLEALLDAGSKATLIIYGSKWGKTTNLNMIKELVEIELDNKKKIIPQKNTKAYKFFVEGKLTLMNGKEISIHPFLISKRTEIVEAYLAAYPVIHISFSEQKKYNSYDTFIKSFSHVISELFKRHSYIATHLNKLVKKASEYKHTLEAYNLKEFRSFLHKKANPASLVDSLIFLSELLYQYYDEKVFILIDEYDAMTNLFLNEDSKYINDDDLFEIRQFMNSFMTISLKGNQYIHKGIITGTSSYYIENTYSSLNILQEFSIFSPEVNLFYGIMKNELDLLLKLFPEMKTQENSINLKYNGYLIQNENFETRACNTHSITQCLGNGKLDNYWVNSEDINGLCKAFLIEDNFRNYIIYLLLTTEQNLIISPPIKGFSTETCKNMKKYLTYYKEKKRGINDLSFEEEMLKLLMTRSYFSAREINGRNYELSIPNDEVRTFLHKIVLSFFITHRLQSSAHTLDQLKTDFESLILAENPNVNEFKKCLQRYLNTIPAKIRTPNMNHKSNEKAWYVNKELYYDILTSMGMLLHSQRIGVQYQRRGNIFLIWRHYVVIIQVKYGNEENDAKALNQAKDSRSQVEMRLDKNITYFFRYIIIHGYENKTANIILHDEKHRIDQVIDIVQCTDEMKTEKLGLLNYDKSEELSIIFKNNDTWWTAKRKNEERGLIQAKYCSPIVKEN